MVNKKEEMCEINSFAKQYEVGYFK